MAQTGGDPLALLTTALSGPPEDQRATLALAKRALEVQPHLIQTLVGYLLPFAGSQGILVEWMIEIIELAMCRSTLPIEAKTQIALQTIETMAQLLQTSGPKLLKLLVQVLASAYPLIFRFCCSNKTNVPLWTTLTACKTRILGWATTGTADGGATVKKGVRAQSIKFLQRVILVHSRGGSDPRVARTDPNLSTCPTDHPFIPVAQLEQDGVKLIEFILTAMYTSRDVDLLTAVFNTLPSIVKQRPNLGQVFVPALTGWTPDALVGVSKGDVRSVEKVAKASMSFLEKSTFAATHRSSLLDALSRQSHRMDVAYREFLDETRTGKRNFDAGVPGSVPEPPPKRSRLEATPSAATPPQAATPPPPPPPLASASSSSSSLLPPQPLAGPSAPSISSKAGAPIFNASLLPVELVVDLVLSNLGVVSESVLSEAFRALRRDLMSGSPSAVAERLRRVALPEDSSGDVRRPPNEGAINPIDVGGGEEEDDEEMSPEQIEQLMIKNQRTAGDDEVDEPAASGASAPEALSLGQDLSLPSTSSSSTSPSSPTDGSSSFELPPPALIPLAKRQSLALSSLKRILDTGRAEFSALSVAPTEDGEHDGVATAGGRIELWMVLAARLVTRGRSSDEGFSSLEDQEAQLDDLREVAISFVLEDFGPRCKFATLWLNEEWYNDTLLSDDDTRRTPRYRASVLQLLNAYLARLSGTAIVRFLLDLPEVPFEIITSLQTLCAGENRAAGRIALRCLRELMIEKPPLREETMRVILELCTHPDMTTRNSAIATARQWLPDAQPMAQNVKDFALRLLRRLQTSLMVAGEDVKMVEGEDEAPIQTRFLSQELVAPVDVEVVRQHVELLFALVKKVPDFLDEIFKVYPDLDPSIQEAFELIATPLIRSLGPNSAKLLTVLRTFPDGADALALRTLQVLCEPKENGPKVKMSVLLVALVKGLVAERSLDPRFILPIVGDLDKSELKRQLPRVVSLLIGKPAEKETVRKVFGQILSSAPIYSRGKLQPSDAFTSAELLVFLHLSEKDSGLKATMEAIDICFSMTDIFKSEVLTAVMQQISEEAELPTLFLRTVIKSVQTYKSLTSFVSTNLLSRLIAKQIWTSNQLWEGFIRVAKILGVASYGALLQLPREQLKDVVLRPDSKTLKAGLKEHVLKKAGGNVARLPGWFAEIFEESPAVAVSMSSPSPPPSPSAGAFPSGAASPAPSM